METQWGQDFLVHQVTRKLSRDLQNRISIKHINIGFFDKLNLEEVLVEDQKRDTLLYAGRLQVHITDWFFFKDKAVLKYVGLQNAKINLQRTDSVWNYQFLADYFASPSNSNKKESGIDFNLKEVDMNNVAFIQKDNWSGQNMTVKFDKLYVDANDISISNKHIDLNQIELNNPYFQLYSYKGLKPTDTTEHTIDTTSGWNAEGWKVKINEVAINNGIFKDYQKNLIDTSSYFDAGHMAFQKINGRFKNFSLVKDTITAAVTLSTTERSGFTIQSLKTNFRMEPKLMEFNDLYLKTPHSTLKNYFAMHYPAFSSLSDFVHAVKLEGNFEDASISSDDIAFFAPEVRDWKKNIAIKGRVKGTIDALLGKNLTVKAGNNTYINGDVSIVGLPNIDQTFISLQANDLRTTYADAVSFVPQIRTITTPNLSKLTYLHFKGNYTGFVKDFVTYGTIETNLGTLVTDLNMKFPEGAPVYSGSLSTTSFQLGQFVNSPQLGIVSFKGDVKGKGFKWNTLDLNINGTVNKIQYNDYTYQNITAKGKLNKKMFDGDFTIKDPNADLHLTGLIDLNHAAPEFNVKADIAHVNLKTIQLTNQDMELSGLFNLNFSGKSLSDFLGDARINNAMLSQNGYKLKVDSLIVSSRYINGVKTLTALSDEFDAKITGNFDLQALPDAFTHFLSHYYPAYIKHPFHPIPHQSFTFTINTGTVDDYLKLIDENLSGFNNSHLAGSLDMGSNAMTIEANVPQVSYKQYQFSDVQLKGNGDLKKLTLNGQVGNAIVSDSLNFPSTTFSIEAQNDVSNINFNTVANKTLDKANLSAQVKTFSDGASILFNPSSFILNGKTWSIEQGGELNFRKRTQVQGKLVLKESYQEIDINTQPSDIGNWNDLHIALRNLNIGDFTPFFVKSNRIEGLLNGNIKVEDPQHQLNVAADFRTDELRLDNDSIGQMQASIAYNNTTGLLTGSGKNLDPDHKISFGLDLNVKDSASTHQDRISIVPVNYPVKILERFLGDLFSNMQGYLTGNLDIEGSGKDRVYIGKGRLKDAGLKINFTQVFYKIDDTEIELTKDGINLGTLKLRDRFGNFATISGSIKHHNFQDMVFDIEAQTDTKPMELLNTSYSDNPQFFGKAMGTGSFSLRGPQDDITMYVNARPSDRDSSYITLPPARNRESGTAYFMVEKKYGKEISNEGYEGSSNVAYQVDLTINPLVNINVILDDLTGDAIKGRGTGFLQIKAGTAEPMSIRGRCDIQEGSYMFTFQSFFKKPFVIKPGTNNYIDWTGDPYSATIHLDAVYKAEQVSFAPLVSGLDQSFSRTGTDLSKYRGDVNVVATLTGDLFRPTFNFQLEVPNNTATNDNPSLTFALQQIEKDPNEINKQVTYLIVFNSFAPFENAQTTGLQTFNEFAYSTISGLFFGEINKRLNQALGKLLSNNNVTVNFTGSVYNRDLLDQGAKGFNINQSNLNLTVGVPIISNKVIVTFGSTFDVPLQSDIQQNIQFLPDVTVEWLINHSGSIRATFFYRQNLDFLTAGGGLGTGGISNSTGALRTTRSGASISYQKEFQSFTKFLFGHRKGKLKPTTNATATDSTAVSQKGNN